MSEADKLRAAGWEVIDAPNYIRIRWGEDRDAGYVSISKNADGTLHLVKARSAFHRQIAGILAKQPEAAIEGADYAPRTYGS